MADPRCGKERVQAIGVATCSGPGVDVWESPVNVATDERCDGSPGGCRHGDELATRAAS